MAGSFNHVLDEGGHYRGVELLENMGDMHEAVEQMAFMLLFLSQDSDGRAAVETAEKEYYERCRGEKSWPEWFKP